MATRKTKTTKTTKTTKAPATVVRRRKGSDEVTITRAELTKMLQAAKAEGSSSKRTTRDITLDVSDKGAIKIKGMRQRWPIVLYVQEMEWILDNEDTIRDFIDDNSDSLSRRG